MPKRAAQNRRSLRASKRVAAPTLLRSSPSNAPRSQPTSVVTGGAGFLGSHLVDLLLQRGHRVIAIDNLVTGSGQDNHHLAGAVELKPVQFIHPEITRYRLPHETVR